jgi:hypothetical protein
MSRRANGGMPISMTVGQTISGELALSKVVFTPGTANDTFLLQDSSGKIVLFGKASTLTSEIFDFAEPIECNGLGLATLPANGTLLVYLA